MAKLYFHCDKEISVYVNGTELRNSPYHTSPNERVCACVIPALTETAYLAYTVVIRIERDNVVSVTGGAQVVTWQGGHVDVYLRPPKLPFRHSPVTLAQTGSKSLATLYNDGDMHLMCEGSAFVVHDVPRLVSYSLTSSEHGEFLVLLTGKTSREDYVLAISSADGGKVVHEHLASKVAVAENGVVVTETLLDMKRRVRTRTYGADGQIISQSFDRTERAFPRALVPYAFLEAVNSGDEEDALTMLAPDLNADINALRDFFGKFDVICHPTGEVEPMRVATFLRSDGITVPRIFTFDVDGTTITSVHEN